MISPKANFETDNLIIYHIITGFILIYKLKKCSAALSERFKWARNFDICVLKNLNVMGSATSALSVILSYPPHLLVLQLTVLKVIIMI